nr:DENN domain-containing protein 3-like isoform X2 [Nothobranchius furzeri]
MPLMFLTLLQLLRPVSHTCRSLHIYFDLDQIHSVTCTKMEERRARRRAWQHGLNQDIRRIALELIVNIFRDVGSHLNHEHGVFHSEEFLKTREPGEQLSYRKDPLYMTPALTNVLLMDAVARCLQTQNSISAASKLAYFDKIKHEAPMIVPETTSEALKHKINPSVGLAEPQTVHLLLYPPGQLSCSSSQDEVNPRLWVAQREQGGCV